MGQNPKIVNLQSRETDKSAMKQQVFRIFRLTYKSVIKIVDSSFYVHKLIH